MIDLYTWSTPNGRKVSIMLEELAYAYEVHPIDIGKGDQFGEEFVGWQSPTGGDETLGLVDFSIFPHLDHPTFLENSLAHAEIWAAKLPTPGYAIDDQTAIQVVDGAVEVITEGHWKLFTP